MDQTTAEMVSHTMDNCFVRGRIEISSSS